MKSTPRVATVQDLSGLGRCSLSVILPVLSVMGAQCCPLTTAVLSAHTGFPAKEQAMFRDLTPEMAQTIGHWQAVGMKFDAIYSGFLGSAQQIQVLSDFISTFATDHTQVLIDPVMGDHGKVYRTYSPEMCQQIVALADRADLITPNFTEAAILLGEGYDHCPTQQADIETWLHRLSLDGTRSVVLTGVSLAPGQLGSGCFDRESGQVHFAMAPQAPGQFSGTGDLFASVLLGGLLQGKALPQANQLAVDFVRTAVAHTLELGTPVLNGVEFESQLHLLCQKG